MALAVLAGRRTACGAAPSSGAAMPAGSSSCLIAARRPIIGDPGASTATRTWLRLLTGTLIGLISVVNAGAAVRW